MTYEPTAELSVRAAHSERSTREMSFEVVDPGARSDWDKQISSFARANFFHSSPWMKALHACYGFEPAYLVRINGFETKVLVPLMEVKSFLSGKRGISLPFTDDCEPLCAADSNLKTCATNLSPSDARAAGVIWNCVAAIRSSRGSSHSSATARTVSICAGARRGYGDAVIRRCSAQCARRERQEEIGRAH